MIRIVRAAIEATLPGGITDDYFRNHGKWEGPLRHAFAMFPTLMAGDRQAARNLAIPLFKALNDKYHGTRRPPDYSLLFDEIAAAFDHRAWWREGPPLLFECKEENVANIARAVEEILHGLRARDHDSTHSLLSKILHFAFPDTFVISDSQAAASIERWSDQEHSNINPMISPRSTYRASSLTDTTGQNYIVMLTLYRRCLAFARLAGEIGNLEAASGRMQSLLRCHADSAAARVTTLDVLDKLLWLADGDPQKLGLGPT